ncbi:MAG: class I tRNA ligase family protein, partial [Candidatus Latescibacteria bacterium]|nr:class I tRNA ligase family protein [Candidatus Latescibacterota bacterium]
MCTDQPDIFSYRPLEVRIPGHHLLRDIRKIVDQTLAKLSSTFDAMYAVRVLCGTTPEAWRLWWQDPGSRLVHFIGKDNIVFHAIMFPGMLMHHSEPWVLPDN